jgi:hypothetical protein
MGKVPEALFGPAGKRARGATRGANTAVVGGEEVGGTLSAARRMPVGLPFSVVFWGSGGATAVPAKWHGCARCSFFFASPAVYFPFEMLWTHHEGNQKKRMKMNCDITFIRAAAGALGTQEEARFLSAQCGRTGCGVASRSHFEWPQAPLAHSQAGAAPPARAAAPSGDK